MPDHRHNGRHSSGVAMEGSSLGSDLCSVLWSLWRWGQVRGDEVRGDEGRQVETKALFLLFLHQYWW